MNNNNIVFTPEVIAQQRAICDKATPGEWTIFGVNQCIIEAPITKIGDNYSARSIVAEMWGGDPGSVFSREQRHANATFIVAASAGYRAALDALEASMQREAEKDAIIARLTSERDAEKKRAENAESCAVGWYENYDTLKNYFHAKVRRSVLSGKIMSISVTDCAENAPTGAESEE